MSGLLQVHPVAQHPLPFSLSLCISPAPSWKWTEDDTNKKALLSAVFDKRSLRDSLIIHASLTGYLLSLHISLLRRMRRVPGLCGNNQFSCNTTAAFLSSWAEEHSIKQTFGPQSRSLGACYAINVHFLSWNNEWTLFTSLYGAVVAGYKDDLWHLKVRTEASTNMY